MEFLWFAGLAITLYFFASILYRLARGLWNLKLGSLLGYSEKFRPKENSWAVITGSTDGIGLAYAHEFLKKGYNLLLISRNPDKLNNVKEQLDSKSNKKGKEIRTYAADFSNLNIYPGIEKELKRLPRIDVLINNVGVSYDHPEYYASSHLAERNEHIINVNIVSCARMCFFVLPIMEQQKYGVVLNISSFSALDPCPLLAIYAASKAFVDIFTRSISYEYAKKGIIIQSVLPGYVVTGMSRIRKAYWLAPNPENYVKSQLRTVGLDDQTTGFWSHELQYYFTQHVFPIVHSRALTANLAFNQMKLMRYKALKKLQQTGEGQRS